MKQDNVVFIFDFDGVIVDSVGSLYTIYLEFLSDFGVKGNREEFDSLNGPNIFGIVSILKNKYSLKQEEEELIDLYRKRLSSIYDSVKLNDAVKETLEMLKGNHFKIALASSSLKNEIESVLNRYSLNEYFEFMVTGDDVETPKPSPEIFNRVKERFPNKEYYAIEDSENGLQAVSSAGIQSIFLNSEHKIIERDVTYEINSLNQVQNIVAEIDLGCFTISKSKKIVLKVVEHELHISPPQKQAIETIWNQESLKNELFNGKIISYLSHKKNGDTLHVEGFLTQYKYFFAQLKNDELNLKITPLGVSGIVLDKGNNLLLAERFQVTEYEGFYECTPSGSIDPSKVKDDFVPFQEQLIEELEEETGLKKEHIKCIEPYCLIFDANNGVYDICSKIYTKKPLQNLVDTKANEEYKNIKIINLENFHYRVEQNNCVPTSIIMINNLE